MARRRYTFDLAGQAFGFDLPTVTEGDGEAKTESVLTDYFPELKFTFSPKTQRGGRLGRSATQVTPEITMRQKEAATLGGGGPITVSPTFTNTFSPQAPAPAEAPKSAAPVRPAISTEFGVNPQYFGHEDYWRNIERGYTPAEIKDYISKHTELLNPASSNMPGKGGLYDQIMAGKVDVLTGSATTPVTTSTPAPAPAKAPEPQYAISSQLSIPTSSPGFVAAPTPSTPPATRAPISTAYGASSQFFGGEDVKAAEAQGYTAKEIFDYIEANKDKGILQGGNVPGAAGGVYEVLKAAAGR